LSNLIADRERQQLDSGRLGFIVVTRSCNKGSCRNLQKLLSDSDFTYSLPYSSWRESFYILVPARLLGESKGCCIGRNWPEENTFGECALLTLQTGNLNRAEIRSHLHVRANGGNQTAAEIGAQRIVFCPQCSVSLALGLSPEGALNVAAWDMIRDLVSSDPALNQAAWENLREQSACWRLAKAWPSLSRDPMRG